MHLSVIADPLLIIKDLEDPAEGRQDGLLRLAHQLRVLLPEDRRRLLQPVVGNLDKEVMDLVGANVVHQVMSPAVVAVNRAELTSDKVPLVIRVPGHVLVLVVQKRGHHEPRGKDEDGGEVVDGEAGEAERAGVGDEPEKDPGRASCKGDDAVKGTPGE